MALNEIKNDVVVSIAYKMFANGELVEEMESTDPLEYLHGHENIVPGLERALAGKKIGERVTVKLQPQDAYGEYDEDAIELVDASELPDDVAPGMELVLEDEDGNFYEVVVREVTDEGVVLDFNPPFAGQEITYDVEIIALREANEDELDHGHPHTYEYEE